MPGKTAPSRRTFSPPLQKRSSPVSGEGLALERIGRKAPRRRRHTAWDAKSLRGALTHFQEEELKQIPILPVGSKLDAKAGYLDLKQLDLGEFTADGGEVVEEGEQVVPKSEVPRGLWGKLLRVDWKIGGRRGPVVKQRPAAAKSKSMKGSDGERKLATRHGRAKRHTGGESQKTRPIPRGSGRRTGSSKQHK